MITCHFFYPTLTSLHKLTIILDTICPYANDCVMILNPSRSFTVFGANHKNKDERIWGLTAFILSVVIDKVLMPSFIEPIKSSEDSNSDSNDR